MIDSGFGGVEKEAFKVLKDEVLWLLHLANKLVDLLVPPQVVLYQFVQMIFHNIY